MDRCGFLVTLDGSTHLCYYDGFNIFIEFDNHIQVLHGVPSEYVDTDIKLSEIEVYSKHVNKNIFGVDYLCVHCGFDKWLTCIGDLVNHDNYSIEDFTSDYNASVKLPELSVSIYKRGSYKFNNFMSKVI